MKQEDKELLLKDLCARLPYNVRIHKKDSELDGIVKRIDMKWDLVDITTEFISICSVELDKVLPYLRPIESITEEEKEEISQILEENQKFSTNNIFWEIIIKPDSNIINSVSGGTIIWLLEWFYEHHFDINNLIERGLALEALKGMYNNTSIGDYTETCDNSDRETYISE